MPTLLALPQELAICILSFIDDPIALIQCRAVCRDFVRLIDSTALLTYRIELYADGMTDCPDYPMAVADRLSVLRARRDAWRKLKPRFCSFPISSSIWNAYELVDGIFAQTLNVTSVHSSDGIQFASLPSRFHQGSVIQYKNVGFSFRDFALDPTQDLVIYMQCDDFATEETKVTLKMQTITDNKAHPLARNATLSMTSGIIQGAILQIVDDVVAFMSWSNQSSKLFIWNWREGKMLVNELSLYSLDDFSLISSRAYVLSNPDPDPSFRIYSFSEHLGPILHVVLRLPNTRPQSRIALLGIHTGPFTTAARPPGSIRASKPFVTAPHARIHVVNLDVLHGAEEGDNYTLQCLLIIHNRTFLSYFKGYDTQSPPVIDWQSWGPGHTYWIPGLTGSQWLRYVHGERLVRLKRHDDTDNMSDIEVYDFGAYRGPVGLLADEEKEQVKSNLKQGPIAALQEVFEPSLCHQLPCRVIRRREHCSSAGFMIDEDRLVGIKRSQNLTNLDVYIF